MLSIYLSIYRTKKMKVLPYFSIDVLLCFVFQAQVQIARDNAVTSQQRSASGQRIRKEACSGTEVDRNESNPFTEQDSGILDVEDEEQDEVRRERFISAVKHLNSF